MNPFRLYIRRNKGICLGLSLLLTASVTFSMLGFHSWLGITRQLRELDAQYTTLAVPVGDAFWSYMNSEDPSFSNRVSSAPGVEKIEANAFLQASIAGTQRVTGLEADNLLNNAANYYQSNLVVVAARCDSVTTWENESSNTTVDENGQITGESTTITCTYEASFTVLDTVSRIDAYADYPMRTVSVCNLYTRDFQIPYQQGQTYLLFGYTPEFATTTELIEQDNGTAITHYIVDEAQAGFQSLMLDHSAGFLVMQGLLVPGEMVESDGKLYYCLAEGTLPVYAQYDGDWQDYLASEEGRVWREVWLPMCQHNYASVNLFLTDNLYSFLSFNDGTASIMEGRAFSADNYRQGREVCLVSAAYAEKNNLSLGDTLEMELYQGKIGVAAANEQLGLTLSSRSTYVYGSLHEDNALDLRREYTIVGIYSAPEFSASMYSFDANTIFVPKASVPDSGAYAQPGNSLLNSVILNNGKQEAFQSFCSESDSGVEFEFYDMGYSAAASSFLAARDNALRLLILGGGVFALVSVLYFMVLLLRLKPTILSMRRLGVQQRQISTQILGVLIGCVAVAVALGTILGAVLFTEISSVLTQQTVPLRFDTVVLIALGQLLVLSGLGWGASHRLLYQNLMTKK